MGAFHPLSMQQSLVFYSQGKFTGREDILKRPDVVLPAHPGYLRDTKRSLAEAQELWNLHSRVRAVWPPNIKKTNETIPEAETSNAGKDSLSAHEDTTKCKTVGGHRCFTTSHVPRSLHSL